MVQAAGEVRAFQADVAKLLHLMVHSVYSDHDIFLRELLSNAADACEKLRYEALADPALAAAPFVITIAIDTEAGTLTIDDNGIGMSADDLAEHLGTIARSGTLAFLEKSGLLRRPSAQAEAGADEEGADEVGADEEGADEEGADEEGAASDATNASDAKKLDLIGQFGIGFYSAFMVADHVDVVSRRAGAAEAFAWRSDGKGTFSIAPRALADAPAQGTRVILHLAATAKDYLEASRLERIVREHSSALTVPIELREGTTAEPRRLTDGSALWTKPKASIEAEDYAEFYHALGGGFDAPALTVHWRAEGRQEYTVLAFVPGSRPFDLFDPMRHGRGKLYVRRVMITDDAELLPRWLRFVRLVVDSADLPLNVSREMIQESPILGAIKKGVANRILQELGKLAETEPENFAGIWDHFGLVLKEGLYEEPERRDALLKIARFATSTHPDGGRTLADYVAGFRTNQTAIYYLLGDDAKRLATSPQLEGFRARGIEVLLLADPVDAFWAATAVGYDGKPFKSVTQGAADIKSVALADAQTETPSEPPAAGLATLYALMKQVLGEAVADVRASDRLSESPACLVAADHGPDRQLERMLAAHGRLDETSKPVLEVNPGHPLVKSLVAMAAAPDKRKVEDIVWLLFDSARLMEGDTPASPSAFAARLTRILLEASSAEP
jgi:molecular chaperone HtpG